jgi:hypothetical protein
MDLKPINKRHIKTAPKILTIILSRNLESCLDFKNIANIAIKNTTMKIILVIMIIAKNLAIEIIGKLSIIIGIIVQAVQIIKINIDFINLFLLLYIYFLFKLLSPKIKYFNSK